MLKEEKKCTKIVEKVIEKESEEEAQQIVDIKSIANDLALNILKANKEANIYMDLNGNKQKGLIDKKGLKQLTSALKDLNDIIGENKETNKETLEKLDEVLKGIGGVI